MRDISEIHVGFPAFVVPKEAPRLRRAPVDRAHRSARESTLQYFKVYLASDINRLHNRNSLRHRFYRDLISALHFEQVG